MSPLHQLKIAGFRMTAPRRRVLEYLRGQAEPQSVAAIHHGLGPGVDLASVYRTVELLQRLGMVVREPREGTAAYRLAGQHHHHIICRSCDHQECLPCDLRLPTPKGFSAVQHAVSLSGVCATCATG